MARYVGLVEDQYLRPIAGAYVTVEAIDNTAAVLTDDNGNFLSQPLITDDYGGYYFNTADGLYTITSTRSGNIIAKEYNVVVGILPTSDGFQIALAAEASNRLIGDQQVAAAAASALALETTRAQTAEQTETTRAQTAEAALDVRVTTNTTSIANLQTSARFGEMQTYRATYADFVTDFTAYNPATAYVAGNRLIDQGALWQNILASTGTAPPTLPTTTNANWILINDQIIGLPIVVPTSDTGTHTDPTNGATNVPNTGIHVWMTGASGTGFHYLFPTDAAYAQNFATLAGHYANDSTNTDVPGGSAGDRGAKYWSLQAQAFANQALGIFTPIFPIQGGGWGVFDPNGYPVMHYRADNTVIPGYTDYTPAVLADTRLYLMSSASKIAIASPRGTIRGEAEDGTVLRWVDEVTSGNPERRSFQIDGARAKMQNTAFNKVVLVLQTGQSLSIGTNASGVITGTPPYPGRALMFNGGTRVVQGGATQLPTAPNLMNDTQAAQLVDLYEVVDASANQFGETQCGGTAVGLVPNLASNEITVIATVGVGGASIDQIGVGTNPYINMIRLAEKVSAWCKLQGATLEIPCVVFDQGESNYPNDNQATVDLYITNLNALQAATESALKATLSTNGFTVPTNIPFLFWQPSSWCVYGNSVGSTHYNGNVPAAQLANAIANPTKFIPLGPQFWSAYGPDGLHATKESYRNYGERIGAAVARIRAGLDNLAVYATNIAGSGTTISITYHANTPLTPDTTNVTDPGQYGFHLFDATGTEIPLAANPSVVGSYGVSLTPNTALTAGQSYTVKIAMQNFTGVRPTPYPAVAAGPTTGPRAPLRDSSAAVSSSAIGSVPLYNWAMSQILTFTAS
ncbi:hypothetical protein [Sphingomonas oryzagri]|uniref:SGNH hydrolase-type esterase domain-containing protein n=1 Tax=Sphingomonas oryzagri TaxID=3042314 RepID=A0ABT6N0Y0_9SPHN|nr:hypothetical protein [Sphingomonas oryzagri]MDH7638965.1 hypothetical protein [Sphingomonas oryzagri]